MVESLSGRWNAAQADFVEPEKTRASIGLIALAPDRVGAIDFEDMLRLVDGVEVFSTRVPMGPVANPEALAAIRTHLTSATELLVPGSTLDIVAFSCTSGTVAIGSDRVAQSIRTARPAVPVSTPIEAGIKGLQAVGATRISLLVPYHVPAAELVASYFEAAGLLIDRCTSFDLDGDVQMNALSGQALLEASAAATDSQSDALFISCTGLRTAGVLSGIEERIGRPVLTSNQVLAWDCLRQLGVMDHVQNRGRLFAVH